VSWVDWRLEVTLRVELAREMVVEGEREDLERTDEMEGAAEARRDMAGDGGAGRLGVRELESRVLVEDEDEWREV